MKKIDRMSVIDPMDPAKRTATECVRAVKPTSFLSLLVFAGMSLGIATMSFAQSYDPDIGTGNIAYMVQPDGSTVRLGGRLATINARGQGLMMQYGSELVPGSVLYRTKNKLYVLNNQMIDGRMVADHARGWVD
jgi:hypothetical protein